LIFKWRVTICDEWQNLWLTPKYLIVEARLWAGQPRNRNSIPGTGQQIFSCFSYRQDLLSGSSNFLGIGWRRFSPRGKASRSMKLTTQLHLVPRLDMRGAKPPLPHTPSCDGAKRRVYFTVMFRVVVLFVFTCFSSPPPPLSLSLSPV
jgi:hypothetical protein